MSSKQSQKPQVRDVRKGESKVSLRCEKEQVRAEQNCHERERFTHTQASHRATRMVLF